jgi:NADH-quinone oxidoreductase subunit H
MFLAATILSIAGTVISMTMVYLERKVSADVQERFGPNRVGPFGLLQTFADAFKLLTKENLIPTKSDHFLHFLAPVIVYTGAFMPLLAISWGRKVVVADLNVGILYILAVGSLTVVGMIMAGWASNNKWSLLGGMRSAGQMLSYEIPNSLAILTVIVLAGTLNMRELIEAQSGGVQNWFVFRSPFAFVACLIFLVGSLAETNRTPFDLPEAESELVSGYLTEYSGIRWSLFMMSEYMGMFAIDAAAVTVFLGGWHSGLPGEPFMGGWHWFLIKVSALLYMQVWLRFVLPRLRVDHLMSMCWKTLVPIGFVAMLGAAGQALMGETGQLVMALCAWGLFAGFLALIGWAFTVTRHVRAAGGPA